MSTFCCPNCQWQALEELAIVHTFKCTKCLHLWVIRDVYNPCRPTATVKVAANLEYEPGEDHPVTMFLDGKKGGDK